MTYRILRFLRPAFALLLFGCGLYLAAAAMAQKPKVNNAARPARAVVKMVGPVSQDLNLNDLPYIAPNDEQEEVLLRRHPVKLDVKKGPTDPVRAVKARNAAAVQMPATTQTFAGMTQNLGCGNCLPPDTDGDVGPNHYIQAVNSSFRVHNKTGNVLAGSGKATLNSDYTLSGPSGQATILAGQSFVDVTLTARHDARREQNQEDAKMTLKLAPGYKFPTTRGTPYAAIKIADP